MRLPYAPPSITPVGVWQQVTLTISLPIGPGTKILSLFHSTEDNQ